MESKHYKKPEIGIIPYEDSLLEEGFVGSMGIDNMDDILAKEFEEEDPWEEYEKIFVIENDDDGEDEFTFQ